MVDGVIVAGNMDAPSLLPGLRRPRPLLPLPEGAVLSYLIARLSRAIDGRITVCAHGHMGAMRAILSQLHVQSFEDGAPRGTAGCLRHCMENSTADEFIVVGGSVWLEDDARSILETHRESGNELTVFCVRDAALPGAGSAGLLRSAGLYVCNRAVLDHIREAGFQDIKEQLIPRLREQGLRVGSVELHTGTTEVLDWGTYQQVLEQAIAQFSPEAREYAALDGNVWIASTAVVAPSAQIIGPCVVNAHAQVSARATIVGPAILGESSRVGAGAELVRVALGAGAAARPGQLAVDECLEGQLSGSIVGDRAAGGRTAPAGGRLAGILSSPWILPLTVAAIFLWSFAPTAARLYEFLSNSADYGAGLLIPAAILYMVYSRREELRALRPSFWGLGAMVFLAGASANLAGALLRFSSVEYAGLILASVGVIMSIVGKQVFQRIWIPLSLLVFMVPFPHRVHHAVLYPLQGAGARIAGTLLETLGIPTEQYGHVLQVAGHRVAVAEACSGLRLALAFLIVTAVVAYIADRPRWQKCIVFLSAIPVALACNVLRIAMSAYFYHLGYSRLAEGAFHDGAGLFMMPAAMLLIALEFKLLSALFVSADTDSGREHAGLQPIAVAAS